MSETENAYQYRVNAQNEIIAVNEAWNAFARYNLGQHLTSDRVVGTGLAAAMPDPEVRSLYERLLDAVRQRHGSATIPFRCDAPDERRVMQLQLQAEGDGHVCLTGLLLKRELRTPVALLDPTLDRNNDTVWLCSNCLRMDLGNDHWGEIEAGLTDPHDRRPQQLPATQYRICPDCRAIFEREIAGTPA